MIFITDNMYLTSELYDGEAKEIVFASEPKSAGKPVLIFNSITDEDRKVFANAKMEVYDDLSSKDPNIESRIQSIIEITEKTILDDAIKITSQKDSSDQQDLSEKYFDGDIGKLYCFALAEMDGRRRSEILGITESCYISSLKAEQWSSNIRTNIMSSRNNLDEEEMNIALANLEKFEQNMKGE